MLISGGEAGRAERRFVGAVREDMRLVGVRGEWRRADGGT